MQFSKQILEQLSDKAIAVNQINKQIKQFETGIKPIELDRACIIKDGIIKLTNDEVSIYQLQFENESKKEKIIKFVPASGAATRMFKHLFDYKNQGSNVLVKAFFTRLKEFPFYPSLKKRLPQVDQLLLAMDYQPIVDAILVGMNYGTLPKGSILFHQYVEEIRTAFEEHLYEGKNYCEGKNRQIIIHFTIAKKHQQGILKLLRKKIHQSFLKENILLNFSYQESNTDTITVDLNNELIKTQQGDLVFRPGGHGALIHNLNTLDADLIFIKNIDNVVPDNKRSDTIKYKKALAGLALEMKTLRNSILTTIDNGGEVNSKDLNHFFNRFKIELKAHTNEEIYEILNRPIRVCGMVKNQNEPGGGPFWIKDITGKVSKQIVEKSQINLKDETQAKIFQQATHFNPVDLVCITKNHKGESINLLDFVDDNTGFITEKSLAGATIKALELPGLWNGAMAKWNTLFVEVPLSTFNPVKTVNDLIRPIRIS